MMGFQRVIGVLVAATVLCTAANAETLVQLNGETSYVQQASFNNAKSGVFSMSCWVWPERDSDDLEALMALSTSNMKGGLTVGWGKGKFFYTDTVKEDPVFSDATYSRKTWHVVTMTSEAHDMDTFFDATSSSIVHRLVKVYVDGELALQVTTRLPDLTKAVLTAGVEYKQYAKRRYFTGLMDEIRVYTKALDAEDAFGYPFIKPSNPKDYSISFYASFNDIKSDDIRDESLDVKDYATGKKTIEVAYCDKITVALMPYDAISVGDGITKQQAFSDTLYDWRTSPLGGSVLDIPGNNFAKSDFLTVEVGRFKGGLKEGLMTHEDGMEEGVFTRGTVEWVSKKLIKVHLPRLPLSQAGAQSLVISNGGYNSWIADITYEYVLGEDFDEDLVAHYPFAGHLRSATDVDDGDLAGSIPKNYGKGGPFPTTDRNHNHDHALEFTRGERVEVPALLKNHANWTLCMWVHATPATRVLYFERDSSKKHVANLLTVDDMGVLSLDGSPGGSMTFDAWQHVCVSKAGSVASFYVSGNMTGTAEAVYSPASMSKGLIGTNITGIVDDVWAWSRTLLPYEVDVLFRQEEYAVELDGVDFWRMTTEDGAFKSATWRPDSKFSVDMWVYPEVDANGHVLFDQPSGVACTDTACESSRGIYLALYKPETTGDVTKFGVVFTVMLDSTTSTFYQTHSGDAETSATGTTPSTLTRDVEAAKWSLITATYDGSTLKIYVNGAEVASRVRTAANAEASTQPIMLGGTTDLATTGDLASLDGLAGMIGEVRLWSRALAAQEVESYFTCPPKGTLDDGLFAYVGFDDGVGSLYHHGKSNGLKVTFTGAKKPMWMSAEYGTQTGATMWENSLVAGAGSEVAHANELANFTFQTRGMCDRLRKVGGDDVKVFLAGPLDRHMFTFDGTISDNGDGTYSGSYMHTTCGHYVLRVEHPDVPSEISPYDLAVTSGGETSWTRTYNNMMAKNTPAKLYLHPGSTNAALSYAYDDSDIRDNDDLATAFAGVPSSFTLQTVDDYGCPRTEGGDRFDVYINGRYEAEGAFTDHKDGKYTISYVPLMEGPTNVNVLFHGEHVGQNGDPDPKSSCGVSLGSDNTGSPWCVSVEPATGSLHFNASSYVVLPDEDHLDIAGGSYTIEAWVKPMAPYTDGRIISKESPYSGHGYWLGVMGMKVTHGIYVGSDTYRSMATDYELAPETWTHLAATYNGTRMTLYANGEEIARETYGEAMYVKENSQKVMVGSGFTGRIDNLRVMTFAKSEEQVYSGMRCPMTNDTVVLYMMFNDGAGNTAFDYSSYGVHGMLKGARMPTWSDDVPENWVLALDAKASSADGQGLASAIVGVPAGFTVDLVDKCGFDYVGGEVGASAELVITELFNTMHDETSYPSTTFESMTAPDTKQEDTHCLDTGSFMTTYTAKKCGTAMMAVTADGEHLPGSPFSIAVGPTTETATGTSEASGVGEEVVAGSDTSFTIQAADAFGCKRTSGGDVFDVLLTRVSAPGVMNGADVFTRKIETTDNFDGTYTAVFAPPAPGGYILDIGRDAGDGKGRSAIHGSPWYFNATAAPWRSMVLDGVKPAARYEPTTVKYDDEMYIFRGFGEDKSSLTDVWKYGLNTNETWTYRSMVTISDRTEGDEVRIVVDTAALIAAGTMRADCSDILFKGGSSSSSPAIPMWIDPSPGCNAAETAIWVKPTEDTLWMYYGNVHAMGVYAEPSDLFVSFDDFEIGSNPFTSGWAMAETCSLPAGDMSAFMVTNFSSTTGNSSLYVDALTQVGGSIKKDVEKMGTFVLRANLYDSDAPSSAHWISPNFDDCVELPAGKQMLPQAFGMGVYTCTTDEYMASTYPWSNVDSKRKAAWRALEFIANGTDVIYKIDGVVVDHKMQNGAMLDKVFIRAGGPDPSMSEAVASWDTIYVARYNGAVSVTIGEPEAVMWSGKDWAHVSTHGTAPPARATDSVVVDDGKLYMIGGFGTYGTYGTDGQTYGTYGPYNADDLVWTYTFETSTWASITPWGSKRLPAREDHTLAISGGAVYVFGGRKGPETFGDLWSYDIADNAWMMVDSGSGPSPRFSHSAYAYKSHMFVFGGFADGKATNDMWAFKFSTGAWAELTPAASPSPRFSALAAVEAGSMYVYGGTDTEEVQDDAWRYDFDYNRWVLLAPASGSGPVSKSELGGVVHDNNLFVFGGHGSESYYNDLWQLSVYSA